MLKPKDSTTEDFQNEEEMSEHADGEEGDAHDVDDKFYSDAQNYWQSISPTVDGMLGGFARISPTDINGSKAFLRPFIRGENAKTGRRKALDCGAGIGRITKRLLLTIFDRVDMVEQNPLFVDQATKFLGEEKSRVTCYCSGLQDFTPEARHYDVIWAQWVLGHLTDVHLVNFFRRCQDGLAPNGIVCIKENVKTGKERDFDEQDSSWTRTRPELEQLIAESGLTIIKKQKQRGFPKALYDVYMYALH